jgi:hypothetical protein
LHLLYSNRRLPWTHPLHSLHLLFSLSCGHGLHTAQLCFTLPWEHGTQSKHKFFCLPWGHPLHSVHSRATTPWGQGVHAAQSPFCFPCGHRLLLIALQVRPLCGSPNEASFGIPHVLSIPKFASNESAQLPARASVTMTTLAPGLKKYIEREASAGAPAAQPGSQVHVHFTATIRSTDTVVDSSRGEFVTDVGGITVRKCNMPLVLRLPENVFGKNSGLEESESRGRGEEATTSDIGEVGEDVTLEKNNNDEQGEKTSSSPAMVRGFALSIASMRLGERSTFCVPSGLAYGALGKGKLAPNEDLDFDIELVGVDGEYWPARKK